MTQKVILDCDPGHDDAMAILLAAKRLDVLGITTVAGNQSIDKVTTNALKVVELAGLTRIPVAQGAAHPLVRAPRHAPEIHGQTGLDGPDLPVPATKPVNMHAVDFIIVTVMRTDGVTLVPTGPLTNIALALRKEPRIAGRIPEICLMGGSRTHGNVTAAAEFNIYFDPEAAHAVFTSGIPIKMVGLNVTEQVIATPPRRQQNRHGVVVAGIAIENHLLCHITPPVVCGRSMPSRWAARKAAISWRVGMAVPVPSLDTATAPATAASVAAVCRGNL